MIGVTDVARNLVEYWLPCRPYVHSCLTVGKQSRVLPPGRSLVLCLNRDFTTLLIQWQQKIPLRELSMCVSIALPVKCCRKNETS